MSPVGESRTADSASVNAQHDGHAGPREAAGCATDACCLTACLGNMFFGALVVAVGVAGLLVLSGGLG